MTTIIDGIDVSGCKDYKCNGICESSAYFLFNYDVKYAPCKNRDCFYKQLKRKEQECEELTSKCSQLEVLKYALEDIRSLINNPKNCVADIIYYTDKTAHDALQKINEVIDEQDR